MSLFFHDYLLLQKKYQEAKNLIKRQEHFSRKEKIYFLFLDYSIRYFNYLPKLFPWTFKQKMPLL